jgi:hypothetical protein
MRSVRTRAQAIAEGVLVDVSEWASDSPNGIIGGFTVPVAVTAAVWADLNAIPSWADLQDVRGRAQELLWTARRAAGQHQSEVSFEAILPVAADPQESKHVRTYRMVMGPGDEGEPVITILLPHEE